MAISKHQNNLTLYLATCDFMCGDGNCINEDYVCDSLIDCTDYSDTQNCSIGLTGVVYLQPSDFQRQCPAANNAPAVCGTSCSHDRDCRNPGELCCDSSCGQSCTAFQPICHNMVQSLLGAFQPSCEDDGSFSEVQCHERSCWCVDVVTGQPVTNGTRDSLKCTRCSGENGESVLVGASFNETW